MSNCRLVLIEWEDSAQPVPGWSHLANFEEREAILCSSVGWLIQDGAGAKVLAPNMGAINDEDNLQASGFMTIPTRCVKRIVDLAEPTFSSASAPSSHLETAQTLQASSSPQP
ncbi:hypothetical protein ACSMXM_05410 [Pacificimonas sp. ICDLI1SI03]